MRVTVLGCGTSVGVPMIGPGWGVCDPNEPKNVRSRASILVEHGGVRVLVDTTPELRQQCLSAGIDTVDAVLFTHAHADHVHGIDDVRALNINRQGVIPAYADADVLRRIRARFDYAFHPELADGRWYRPVLEPVAFDGAFAVDGLRIEPFAQGHGGSVTWGFRFGAFAYSTDADHLSEAAFALLAGVQVWLVDCLRDAPHPSHAHLERTLGWIARLKPRLAVLTHMNNELDYAELAARLPDGVVPAYDGMVIDVAAAS